MDPTVLVVMSDRDPKLRTTSFVLPVICEPNQRKSTAAVGANTGNLVVTRVDGRLMNDGDVRPSQNADAAARVIVSVQSCRTRSAGECRRIEKRYHRCFFQVYAVSTV